jgi:CRP/FNR family transcriptional regulator
MVSVKESDPQVALWSDVISGQLGALLALLEPAVRAGLEAQAVLHSVPAGTILTEPGQTSPKICYVISGTLAMTQVIDDGRKHIIGLLMPTDLHGRLFDAIAAYRIEALSDATLCCFDRVYFQNLMQQNPDVERLFLLHILDELDAAREWLFLISGRKVINRTAALLAILARRTRPKTHTKAIRVQLPLRRQELAHYLGTSPESLSRSFHELADRGILDIIDPQHFAILDLGALIEISGHDMAMDDDS